ncbi:MAG: ATP-binding protein, partial [Candidatus Omnitrophota bacterium]|nr:ATP-binding protein [Candidatus Omnitrophota bacterium]
KIVIENFKKFQKAEINTDCDNVLLVGQNNGGKTTALQAVSLWGLLIQQWRLKKGKSKAKKRTGAPISRNEIYAAPVRESRMLWLDGDVQDKSSKKIKLRISLTGVDDKTKEQWEYGIDALYANQELIFCKPTHLDKKIPAEVDNIFHLPPLSGVQTLEKRIDVGAQRRAIGEGRPGEIVRNLLLELYETKSDKWKRMNKIVTELFGLELLPIKYNPQADPDISVFYRSIDSKKTMTLEIASGGSGFLQFLLIAAFLYAHENAILLIDEPDSHMHVFLQKGMYDWLQQIADENRSQLIVSTHSEVIVNNTSPEQIVCFFGREPQRFSVSDKRLLIRALREVSSLDIINAQSQNIVFAEGNSDFKILKEWADILNHPVKERLHIAFFRPYGTNDISAAMKYFTTLKSITRRDLKAICIRDRTSQTKALPNGFAAKYWERNEIENYLIYPEVLIRFISKQCEGPLFAQALIAQAEEYLKRKLPLDVIEKPLENDISGKGSDFLDKFFTELSLKISKSEYYKIANLMKPEEINREIIEMLDVIGKII